MTSSINPEEPMIKIMPNFGDNLIKTTAETDERHRGSWILVGDQPVFDVIYVAEEKARRAQGEEDFQRRAPGIIRPIDPATIKLVFPELERISKAVEDPLSADAKSVLGVIALDPHVSSLEGLLPGTSEQVGTLA